jgi:TolB-like protein/DNA-binding winged helix-turn-helix (wHTH) protein/tetratricopeptide (TPR) repeat protein
LYQFDDYILDVDKFELLRAGEVQHVEPLIFDFLHFLVKNPNRILAREEIVDEIWDGRIVSDATLNTCIKSARIVIGDSGENQKYIKTIRGRGIQFIADVSTASANKSSSKKTVRLSPSISIGAVAAFMLVCVILYFNFAPEERATELKPQSLQSSLKIAVIPFTDMSENGDQEYFGDGMAEEILNVLTAVDDLDVVSRSTSFSLKGQNLSVPEIAEMLGVNYILEGSVRSDNNRIRVTAQLIDASSDNHLWSESYDRELTSIFDIQDDISLAIAEALKIELGTGITERVSPTSNMVAYEFYLQGHQLFLNRGTSSSSAEIDNLERAIVLLGQATSLDANFAEAWADLATINVVLPTYFGNDYSFEDVAPRALVATERAIELNPALSQAWAVRGFIHLGRFEFEDAKVSLIRATELNPNNETAWLWLGLTYSSVAAYKKAKLALERATQIAPTSAVNYNVLGVVEHAMGNLTGAASLQNKSINEMGFELGRIDLALLAIENNEPEKALKEITAFYKNSNQPSSRELEEKLKLYVNAYFDPSLSDQAKERLAVDMENSSLTAFFGAYMVQDGENMVRGFEKETANRGFNIRRIYYAPARPLFQQIEFREHLIRIGLLDYWQNNEFPKFCHANGEDDFMCE